MKELSNSTGQGTSFAPVGTSMVMAKTLDNKIENRSDQEKEIIISQVQGVKLCPSFFVDDLAKNCNFEPNVSQWHVGFCACAAAGERQRGGCKAIRSESTEQHAKATMAKNHSTHLRKPLGSLNTRVSMTEFPIG